MEGCHGEQKANSYNSRKNNLKTSVVVVVVVVLYILYYQLLQKQLYRQFPKFLNTRWIRLAIRAPVCDPLN